MRRHEMKWDCMYELWIIGTKRWKGGKTKLWILLKLEGRVGGYDIEHRKSDTRMVLNRCFRFNYILVLF